ncbi:MAG: matrixin family metalloprotease [Gemmatimonadota bacterium]
MRRIEVCCAITLFGLAAFVGAEALDTRAAAQRTRIDSGSAAVDLTTMPVTGANDPLPDVGIERAEADDVRRRLTLAARATHIGEILAAHDSSLARWRERRADPLRVWIQPVARIRDWSPLLPPLVRDAFIEWGLAGVPLNFTFVLDSASADVHVSWVDRFNEPISGKTLWTHDDAWWILDASIMLAVHHRNGEPLDTAAMRAIALHEVGHVIGLDHTRDSTSIMASRVRVRQISATDRATAQLLYSLPPGRIGRPIRSRAARSR